MVIKDQGLRNKAFKCINY